MGLLRSNRSNDEHSNQHFASLVRGRCRATLSVVLNVLGVLANQPDEPPIALLVSVIGPTNTICYRGTLCPRAFAVFHDAKPE